MRGSCEVDVAGEGVRAIRWLGDGLELLDQRLLPHELRWIRCTSADEVAEAIREMVVRGAPAIGIAAAYGLALAVRRGESVDRALAVLAASRPTAVNLRWALDRLRALPPERWEAEAVALHADDVRINRALGDHGAALLPEDAVVYHHCNTGALATGGWGTALGIVRSARAAGKRIHVVVGETRPWLQGARLTAWELLQEGIGCTLVADVAAATVLQRCHAVLVGCDRVAANGDTANKVGTLGLAVLARWAGIPMWVAMPSSTLDRGCPDGGAIPVEERPAAEVRGWRDVVWAPDVPVFNPSFDITPASLISGWVTEHGVWKPPFPVVAGRP